MSRGSTSDEKLGALYGEVDGRGAWSDEAGLGSATEVIFEAIRSCSAPQDNS